ncbi:MAG: MCP four helix bundle domain-containing protein [Candidatus Omnitrophica bacterium]|nr:MCP four helix bundle domain-containing protein [Candidatus Omnitrophota bacterium]MCF7878331.1 MCP four helix bundle domain-containing protein [Candidatus Omnitrophota bacterium]
MKKHSIDWRLLSGFAALLFLIVIIGSIGIYQIQSSVDTVIRLGEDYLPVQRAVLEMRISNSLYAMEIRNYVFWKGSKYLDSAKLLADSETIKETKQNFSQQLEVYASFAKTPEQKDWVERVRKSEQRLQDLGSRIIEIVNQKANRREINKFLMRFESLSYQIDEFLNNKVESFNLKAIKSEIASARIHKKRSILFLSWSLVLGLLIGAATAAAAYHNQRRQQQQQKQLTQKMIKIEEENKADFSLQIHDQMGQDLSALKIYLDLISQATEEDGSIKENAKESKKILKGLIEKTHNISELIRPPALDEVGLLDTISALVDQYKKIGKIDIDYRKPTKSIEIPREHSLTIYRLAQEGLTNIIKHAQATKVKLFLEVKDGNFKLILEDNGEGFDYKKYLKTYRRRKQDKLKLGLSGLKERVTLLGGTMEVKTAPGKGTILVARLPYN